MDPFKLAVLQSFWTFVGAICGFSLGLSIGLYAGRNNEDSSSESKP